MHLQRNIPAVNAHSLITVTVKSQSDSMVIAISARGSKRSPLRSLHHCCIQDEEVEVGWAQGCFEVCYKASDRAEGCQVQGQKSDVRIRACIWPVKHNASNSAQIWLHVNGLPGYIQDLFHPMWPGKSTKHLFTGPESVAMPMTTLQSMSNYLLLPSLGITPCMSHVYVYTCQLIPCNAYLIFSIEARAFSRCGVPTKTLQPANASTLTVSSPIPEDPPVTSATLPAIASLNRYS